jgi:hypothetical protein
MFLPEINIVASSLSDVSSCVSLNNRTNQHEDEYGLGIPILNNIANIRQKIALIGLDAHPLIYKLLQEFFTWLTGKPYLGQIPSFKVGKNYQLATGFLSLILGIVTSSWIVNFPSTWPLLIISWAYTVGGARKLQTTICHHCTHYKYWGDKRDKWLAECLSTILLTQNFHDYFEEHVKQHHDIRQFTNHQFDPDLQLLYMVGFNPNLVKLNPNKFRLIDTEPYWRHLWMTIFSPGFHLFLLKARFQSNFQGSSIYRRIASLIWVITLIFAVIFTQLLPHFFIVIVFPLTVLYHIASLLQFLSEHDWWSKDLDATSKSYGRFCGEDPPLESSILAWCSWTCRMFFHFLVRLTILNGDLPQHDWHHRSPKTQKDWPNSTYARQREVEAGASYTEFWGVANAIEHVFQKLAIANIDL